MQRLMRLTDLKDRELQAYLDDVIFYSKQLVFLKDNFGMLSTNYASKILDRAIDKLVSYVNAKEE